MPASVIMPALELAQETGKVLRWLKAPGDRVRKGEPLVEIETDKVTTEIEAPAPGILRDVTAREGDVVPVGQMIALIVEEASAVAAATAPGSGSPPAASRRGADRSVPPPAPVEASPVARKIAEPHGVDLVRVATRSGRIESVDAPAHVERGRAARGVNGGAARLSAASPKARRLAAERGLGVESVAGSGPAGAVLAADVLASAPAAPEAAPAAPEAAPARARGAGARGTSTIWRVMAERMTASWTTAPHFYLVREVHVGRLVSWRERASRQSGARVTFTDLLVKLVAASLSRHPGVNASWRDGAIVRHADINIGLAVALDEGLIVPVIHRADTLGLAEIARRREDLVSRGQAGALRPADIQGGGLTISNLGMYGVDAFSAILNPPQAAILAIGRIADRVVAVEGQPTVQATMVLTLACDHRALDGARAAQFLGALADLIEEPLGLLT